MCSTEFLKLYHFNMNLHDFLHPRISILNLDFHVNTPKFVKLAILLLLTGPWYDLENIWDSH